MTMMCKDEEEDEAGTKGQHLEEEKMGWVQRNSTREAETAGTEGQHAGGVDDRGVWRMEIRISKR